MADGTNNSARFVPCSFCDEKFSPSAIGGHLMTCGNKTDQCPNCRKFIRRAVFAYHYENGCANLEEIDRDDRAAVNQRNTPSTFQPNNPISSSSRSTAENNKYRTELKGDLPTHSGTQNTTSQELGSVTTTMICPYCHYGCDPAKSRIHQENCLQNPQNTAKKQQPRNNPTSSQNADQLNHVDEAKDTDEIPCEVCNQLIKWSNYPNHMRVCAPRNPLRIQEPQDVNRWDAPASARCIYCTKEYMITTVQAHQKSCKKNPAIIALETQHNSIFYLPLLPGCPFY